MENNNQDIKLCPSCGAKNKSAYKYCNECGAALTSNYLNTNGSSTENIHMQGSPYGMNGSYYGNQYTQNSYTPNYIPYGMNVAAVYEGTPDFNGVAAKDVYEFTGENPKLFNKLRTQLFSGKTGPYCWPLFILGLIFRFFGMGCWYLYHKMYKPAIAFFIASTVELAINVYSIVLSLNHTLNNFTTEMYNEIMNGVYGEEGLEILSDFMLSGDPMVLILDEISSMIALCGFVLAIVLPFFAYRQYKNLAIKKIRYEYSKDAQPQLTLKGGTSGGWVAFVAAVYGCICFAFIILIASWFLNGMYQKAQDDAKANSNNGYHQETPFGDDSFGLDDFGELW